MPQDTTNLAPTSTATTIETEPEVVAGISSGDLDPSQPLSFRIAGVEFGWGRALLLLGAGMALGYGATRLLRSRL